MLFEDPDETSLGAKYLPVNGVSFNKSRSAGYDPERDRRLRMADLLEAQVLAPIERNSYNGIEGTISPLEGLTKALQGYTAGVERDRYREIDPNAKPSIFDVAMKRVRGMFNGK